jgi:hypothetical protein
VLFGRIQRHQAYGCGNIRWRKVREVRGNAGNLPPFAHIFSTTWTGLDGESEMTEHMPDGINRNDVLMGRIMVEKIKNNGWISVKDKLPEDYKWGLVWGIPSQADRNITTGYYCDKWGWHTDCDDQETGQRCFETITHWMSLPELPND